MHAGYGKTGRRSTNGCGTHHARQTPSGRCLRRRSGAAFVVAPRGGVEVEEIGAAFIGDGTLLGFHDEAAAFVEIDELGGGAAVAIVELDRALEDVGVVAIVGGGGVRAGDGEQVA